MCIRDRENGAPIGDDVAKLRVFFDRGVRYVTLAHSDNNRIADSSYATEKQWHGLSPFGREVVAEMNRLGMMVDVSHLSDDAVAQSVALSRAPVVATHSAFRHFTPGFERNLSDALAKAIADKGGVIQVPFGNAFVDPASAARTQAYFVAYNAYQREKATGRTTQTVAEFDAAWEQSHPPLPVKLDAVLDQDVYKRQIEDGALGWKDGLLAFVGPRDALPAAPEALADEVIEVDGGWVTPGLVDCHTHLVFAGDRAHEFELRLQGASYEAVSYTHLDV